MDVSVVFTDVSHDIKGQTMQALCIYCVLFLGVI